MSKILSQTSNDENIQRAVDFYVSERPQLVDIENDYVVASREKIKEAKSQVSEDKKTDKVVSRNLITYKEWCTKYLAIQKKIFLVEK